MILAPDINVMTYLLTYWWLSVLSCSGRLPLWVINVVVVVVDTCIVYDLVANQILAQ